MYDPLKHHSPGIGENYPNSYWFNHSGLTPNRPHKLQKDINVDVAIIGAGYTGLSCAYHLATEHKIKAHILEANQTAWGCSGRNAGFILKSTGRKPYSRMVNQWGESVAKGIYNEACEGVETVNHLINKGIDCDPQAKGYIRVAHKSSMVKPLQEQAKLLKQLFSYDAEFISQNELKTSYFDSQHAYGAIRFSDGYGINPLKLALGYQDLAVQAGTKIFTASPVEQVISLDQANSDKNSYKLITPEGIVTAKKVVIATNGYTPNEFHSSINSRMLPVLSQIIVTRPLTNTEMSQCNFITSNVVMDTRALKYYFRKLPDNRLLFGGRGAINGKDAEDPYYANRLLTVLKSSFPALSETKIDYSWSGWICMALDDLPHIVKGDKNGNLFYSAGYCGNGVSFSVQAGKRLAQQIAGQAVPNLPLYNQHLPKFPLPAFRRIGQWGYFQYGKIKDRWL
ncbi:MAG: glycine/D-amino acid oxidase-like deaminating enzyme [Polaribacter sp.]|jgi:glycine/D-amino acid oxidase-like deaminating enzyme